MAKGMQMLQITTAEQVLRKALVEKRRAIGKAAYEKEVKKYASIIRAYNRRAVALYQDAQTIQEEVRRGSPKLYADVYGMSQGLPHSTEEAERRQLIKPANQKTGGTYIGGRYVNDISFGDFEPKLEAEEAKVDDFILKLKLGTALMEDLDKLLAEIKK